MRLFLISILLLLCTACSTVSDSFSSQVLPFDKQFVTIYIEDGVVFDKPGVRGDATWSYVNGKKFCKIRLAKYPNFLGHEVRHCFEGYWHPNDVPNGEQF